MGRVKIFNNGYVLDKEKVREFIQRLSNLIKLLEVNDIECTEVREFRDKIIDVNMYNNKDIWYVEDIESRINNYLNNEKDLPF